MGLDVLDLVFRLERKFAIRINRDEIVNLYEKNVPRDTTVGDIFDLVRRLANESGIVDDDLDGDAIWLLFQVEVSDAFGVNLEDIKKDSWMHQDLGAS